MKRELASKFAYGFDTAIVTRYIKMIDWASEFEEYHINVKGKDKFEVKHRANEYFQYFDELSKGTKPGTVAYELGQNDSFKCLVFDLLFEGKFKNWSQIRKLKFYDQNVLDELTRAREETDQEEAQDIVERVLADVAIRRRELRTIGTDARIETFVKWLKDLPISAFSEDIRPQSLLLLLEALEMVQKQVEFVMSKTKS
jgi:hypothetical protein